MNVLKVLTLLTMIYLLGSCKADVKQAPSVPNPEPNKEEEYLNLGKNIAANSFQVLAGRLKAAMNSGGIEEAISYCNIQAHPLTDSLSRVYNASIKRTSLKLRNPKNRPSQKEREVLIEYQKVKDKELFPEPFVDKNEQGEYTFYSPIVMNELCLKCHGEPNKTLSKEVENILQTHYPHDQAINYTVGDLRGMWSITFKN